MLDLVLRDFLNHGKASDAIKILKECQDKKIPNIGVELGKFFKLIFPLHSDILLQLSLCAFDAKNYSLSYDTAIEAQEMNISETNFSTLSRNISICSIYVADRYIEYNPEIIQKIVNRLPNPFPMVTLTITTCKRYDLFEKTINSFLNCCTDLNKIDKWLCVDDNSSEEDRTKMQEKYPFFEFYFKTFVEKGHPQSMNIIRKRITTPYIFHMEDDWKFITRKNYITLCTDVISQSDKIGQCLINKNYSETEKDIRIIGGVLNRTDAGTRYFLHEYCATKQDYDNFFKRHGQGSNCAYWKHFSFRPSLLKKHILDELGEYDEKVSHFEAEYSDRYFRAGYVSAFLDGIYSLHIGRLTSERFDSAKMNAYTLNGEKQLSGKENGLNMNIKTYVLNLDRRPDRWYTFLKQEDPKFLEYHRFSAVDGSKLLPNDQLQRIFEGNDYHMRQGMVGCAMSHVKMCIELINSPYDAFCILEDDVKFVPNFKNKFTHVYSTLPIEWDICYLGHHLWKQYKTPEFFDKEAIPILEKWSMLESLKYSMGGTGGYIISKNGACKLLEFINSTGMTNGIDTVQQKSADILNIYYCKPHLIYSECCTLEIDSDTDIQYNFTSLDLQHPGDKQKYPERLKKDGKFDIDDALIQTHYFIACSETTHTSEAIKAISGQKLQFPFDLTDGGIMDDFAEIIIKVCSLTNNIDFLQFIGDFCLNNPYKIIFPHEKVSQKDLIVVYAQKFQNLYNTITKGRSIVIIHVSRWKKTDPKVFQKLLDFLRKYNPKNRIITVNGLDRDIPDIDRKCLHFPENFANDSWNNEKVRHDQDIFRTELISLLKNTINECF